MTPGVKTTLESQVRTHRFFDETSEDAKHIQYIFYKFALLHHLLQDSFVNFKVSLIGG